MGALDRFKKRIIASDGGPGHFKVYKTQYWMSRWASELKKDRITLEWNMYFANLGHNLCDAHAGKMKVQVKEAEGNYHAMVTASDVIQAIEGKLSNQISIMLEPAQIDDCDEENVKPVGKGFIRDYHHFSYRSPGVVACSYIKGGDYVLHKMKQGAVSLTMQKKLCGECGNPYENDVEVEWFRCNGCRQWYHGECIDLSASAADDEFFVFNSCPKCAGKAVAQPEEDEDEDDNGNEDDVEEENSESDEEEDESTE